MTHLNQEYTHPFPKHSSFLEQTLTLPLQTLAPHTCPLAKHRLLGCVYVFGGEGGSGSEGGRGASGGDEPEVKHLKGE